MERKIISIDEERCTGCGACIPNCPEGALQIIDGKARLVSDLFCDGLGACIGECPEGAITIESREAVPYDERAVLAALVRQGPRIVAAHLAHLRAHGEERYLGEARDYLAEIGHPVPGPAAAPCPGAAAPCPKPGAAPVAAARPSRLRQWPVQIALVPLHAPFLDGADLLIAADCVPFAFADFHEKLLAGRALLVGCPKLDDAKSYLDKLTALFAAHDIRSVTVAHMEVPCCFGLVRLVEAAIEASGKKIPFVARKIGVAGDER